MEWLNQFSERERAEINFALTYVQNFDHGTDGHNRLMVIAKLARALNEQEKKLKDLETPPFMD